jgi:hypothetical protein
MYGLLLVAIIGSTLLVFTLLKITTTMSVKIAAYALDFALVFGFACYLTHVNIASKLATGYMVIALDIAVALLATLIYGVLIVIIHNKLPRLSKVLNFIVVVLGVSVAFPLTIDFITSILKVLGIMNTTWTKLTIFADGFMNTVVHNAIIVLLSVPVFIGRMKYLNSKEVHNERV